MTPLRGLLTEMNRSKNSQNQKFLFRQAQLIVEILKREIGKLVHQ